MRRTHEVTSQDAETARVDRELLVEAELHAEVGDSRTLANRETGTFVTHI
jgi:hypothetical protein